VVGLSKCMPRRGKHWRVGMLWLSKAKAIQERKGVSVWFPWTSSLFGNTTPIGYFFLTYCSVHGLIWDPNACFMVSCNRYKARPYPCEIWTQVVHLSSEEWAILYKKKGWSMRAKKPLFLFFPPKLSGQPAFKFDINMDVRRIYCMIPRTLGFLRWVHFF
jgi:hypothetical protein